MTFRTLMYSILIIAKNLYYILKIIARGMQILL